MAFDQSTRNRLARFVGDARRLVADEFSRQFESLYGIGADGTLTPVDQLSHLDEAGRATAERLRERIRYLVHSHPESTKPDAAAVDRLAREQAFTVLNRLAALRMAEKRGLIVESVGNGYQSKGFKVYETVAGTGLGDAYHRYRCYLYCLFDELAVDLGVLFDRRLPSGLLFPREKALLDLLALLNAPELDVLWAEDETIGWIYQYYNDEAERKKMREQSSAPRNSRELAVRNQFFTPRYVVRFLTDNTLGRLWYEMTRGKTQLKEQCRYLVRRPAEIFLPSPKTLFWHDVPGQEALRKFCASGDPADLPESPELGVLFGWLACITDIPTPYFDGLHGRTLDGLGFVPQLRAVGIDPEALAERWQRFLGGETSTADPVQAHTLELLHLLWLIPAQQAIRGDYHWGTIHSVETLPAVALLWRTLCDRLLNPPAGMSQDELLRQPVMIPFRAPKDPREIRLLDPACGSMHFGLYAFDLFETIYAEAWDLGLIPPDAFGGDTPPFPHTSVRADRRQESVVSNDSHQPVSATTARVVMPNSADGGDGMHTGPFLVDDQSKFRVGIRWEVPWTEFDYGAALAAGRFTPEEGERLVRKTPGAWEHDRIDPLPEEERLAVFRRDIPRLIVEKNIHGIDIDSRAVQIAGLSLWLRAQRAWHQAGVKGADRPRITRSNLVCAEPMPGDKEMLREFVEQQFPAGERPAFAFLLETVFDRMTLAGEAGSLLRIEEEIRTAIADAKRIWKEGPKLEQGSLFAESVEPADQGEMRLDLSGITDEQFWEQAEQRIYDALEAYAEQAENGEGFQRRLFADDAAQGFAFIDLCRRRYDVVVMNPPFGEPSIASRESIYSHAFSAKADVGAAFLEVFSDRLTYEGRLGVLITRALLFHDQLENWRTRLLLGGMSGVTALADLGYGVLDAVVEATAFCVAANHHSEAVFLDCLGSQNKSSGLDTALAQNTKHSGFHLHALKRFKSVPLAKILYAASDRWLRLFVDSKAHPHYQARAGLASGNDDRFLRLHWEVDPKRVGPTSWRWFAKGGDYGKYQTDLHLVINWRERGEFRRSGDLKLHGKPGITYTERTTSNLSARVLNSEAAFSYAGPALIPYDISLAFATLAVTNSFVVSYLIEIISGGGDYSVRGSAARHFYPSFFERFPAAPLDRHIGYFNAAIRSIIATQRILNIDENHIEYCPPFRTPSANGSLFDSLSPRWRANYLALAEAYSTLRTVETTIGELLDLSREDCEDAYNVTGWPWSTAATEIDLTQPYFELEEDSHDVADVVAFRFENKLSHWLSKRIESLAHVKRVSPESVCLALSELRTVPSTYLEVQVRDLASWAVGCAFGRWDTRYATGERPAPELPDPFAPLSACPPGMLQGDDGLPLSPEVGRQLQAEGLYPLDVAWDGILVDDPEHPLDLERCVQAALAVLWGERADALEQEACSLLGVPTLREWYRRPASFFADHLKRYSKSRRQAPIYWPLSTTSGRYTIWLYYHRLNDQTLHRVIADFLNPKLKSVQQEITDSREPLSPGRAPVSSGAIRLAELQELHDELTALRTELERVIALPWRPNLNDGVLITASPLWRLFRLSKWQKDLKACWESLATGEYDWAHLAYTIWPDRVRDKCRKDRSLAIAHGLEALCTVEPPKPKAKRKIKAADLVENES